MHPALLLATAAALGSLHAFGADHVAAVSAFALRRPGPRAALGFGLRWAAGHGAATIALGTILAAAGAHLPAPGQAWLERIVGATLLLLGGWTIAGARTLHAHAHTHADGTTHTHLHSHLLRRDHRHGHAATAVGALHGLAGAAPALALLPLTPAGPPWLAAGCLALFAAGTAAGMALYALLAGWIAGRAAQRSARLARTLATAAGAANLAIGTLWLLRP